MVILWTTVATLLFLATIALHELGHARTMAAQGVYVEEAGLGFALPPQLTLYKRAMANGETFRFKASPWLVGAYVRPTEKDWEKINKAPYHDFAWMLGVGVVLNLVAGGALLAAANVLTGHFFRASIMAAVAGLIWVLRRQFASYAIPALAVPVMIFMVWSIIGGFGEATGPVGVAKVLLTSTPADALGFAGVLSIGMGLFNILPIYPLDGGRIVGRALAQFSVPRRAVQAFETVGSLCMLGLLLYVVVTDIVFA